MWFLNSCLFYCCCCCVDPRNTSDRFVEANGDPNKEQKLPDSSPQRRCVCHTWRWSPCLSLAPCHLVERTPPWSSLSTVCITAKAWWGCSGLHSAPCSLVPTHTFNSTYNNVYTHSVQETYSDFTWRTCS